MLHCVFDGTPTAEHVYSLLHRASQTTLAGILDVRSVPKKRDFSGHHRMSSFSAIVNSECISVAPEGTLAEIHAWYDNEYAYSMRIVDLIDYIAQREGFVVQDEKEYDPEYIPRPQIDESEVELESEPEDMYGF